MQADTLLKVWQNLSTNYCSFAGIAADPTGTKSFGCQTRKPTESVYADGTAPLAEPDELRVAHDVSKNGATVNSVMIRDVCGTTESGESYKNRCQIKLTYDKTSTSEEELRLLLLESALTVVAGFAPDAVLAFMHSGTQTEGAEFSTSFDVDKFLNREH